MMKWSSYDLRCMVAVEHIRRHRHEHRWAHNECENRRYGADVGATPEHARSICVLGMTLDELKREVNLRYAEEVWGLEVEPHIEAEAPHFIYVYGEVNKPDRYQLNGPTTVSQALALAGSIKLGGNQRTVVIFRRMEDWRVVATQVDLKGQYLGRVMTPKDDIWLRDNDRSRLTRTRKLSGCLLKSTTRCGVWGKRDSRAT